MFAVSLRHKIIIARDCNHAKGTAHVYSSTHRLLECYSCREWIMGFAIMSYGSCFPSCFLFSSFLHASTCPCFGESPNPQKGIFGGLQKGKNSQSWHSSNLAEVQEEPYSPTMGLSVVGWEKELTLSILPSLVHFFLQPYNLWLKTTH